MFLYIFSLPQKIDEEVKAYKIEEAEKLKEEQQRLILKEKHDKEYRRTKELLKSSLNYFYSQLIKDYIATELDESTNEYSWALNKANWIRDSNKYPDDLLTAKDKDDLINIKTTNRYFYD